MSFGMDRPGGRGAERRENEAELSGAGRGVWSLRFADPQRCLIGMGSL